MRVFVLWATTSQLKQEKDKKVVDLLFFVGWPFLLPPEGQTASARLPERNKLEVVEGRSGGKAKQQPPAETEGCYKYWTRWLVAVWGTVRG